MPDHSAPVSKEYKWLLFFTGLAVLINFSGLFIPLMDPDAAVYASISKNMLLRHNWMDLYFQGNDWLDKPHFPFWITAVFFKLFGVHTWTYKLPAVLFVLMGARYTYLFAKQYYSRNTALWAVFILLTAEHLILSNNDVRAEPYLTGLVMAAIYHFSNAINKKVGWHLLAGSLFAGCAMMTKGLFTLIPIGAAIAGELIIKKKWKEIFHWRWLIALALIIIFITPELYSLWHQFDSHLEKTVLGRTGVSGIHFFLWDSQFGRFMNTGPIKGNGDPVFFFHTLLWAFLPWSLLMYGSIISKIRNAVKKKDAGAEEWFTLCGSFVTIIIFSLSRFQLPHYTNIIFPLLAILTAQFMEKIRQSRSKAASIVQNSVTLLLLAVVIVLHYYYQPVISSALFPVIIIAIFLLMILLPLWISPISLSMAIFRAGLVILAINLYLNTIIYPDLLRYQSGSEAAFYMNRNYPGVPAVRVNVYAPSFEFYLKDTLIKADTIPQAITPLGKQGLWYVSEEEVAALKRNGINVEIVYEFPDFHVTALTTRFLNEKTRNEQLKKYFLVKVL